MKDPWRLHCRAVLSRRRPHPRTGCALHAGLWLALLGVWTLALMPTLARAWAGTAAAHDAWAVVCTAQGLRPLGFSGEAQGPAAPVGPVAADPAHCPFCQLAGQVPLLPSAGRAAGSPPDAAGVRPAGPPRGARAAEVWQRPQARGPPQAA